MKENNELQDIFKRGIYRFDNTDSEMRLRIN